MEKIAAAFSRNLYLIPGGYFLVQWMKCFFAKAYTEKEWRTFKFRGIQMKVDISKSMGASIYWRGAHDWRPIFVLEKLLKKGNTFIDIGANQGEYALWAVRKTTASGNVLAFEPMDAVFAQLKENISLNPDYSNVIQAIQMGLSDRPGEINLYGKEGSNEGVNTIYPTPEHTFLIQKIKLDTLDNQLEHLRPGRVDLIKIDVEGAELQVLKGATKCLTRFKPSLIIEINKEACQSAGYEAQDILEFLKNFGYAFKQIGLRGKLKPIDRLQDEFCNILAFQNN
ncbi:FkbM family methyltransferase [Cecembia calidifontis]|uniref:FkbM family methyltransferase n=1 Tax=Cecembia calidifontis TaxID=1187080 RepID=A0A4Q7PAS8_9BACT|nr:FkbM family methyltransferase [Cecembia calidifontis]RZS97334.1 FkbM family methyltransferase [Cecembia calidifontis]